MITYCESDEFDLVCAGVCTDDERWGIDTYVPMDPFDEIAFGWSYGAYSGVIRLNLLSVVICIKTPFYIRRKLEQPWTRSPEMK